MEFAHTPGGFVREPVVADLAGLDHRGHAFDLLADRRSLLFLGGVELGRTEHRHVALRPVDLVEVDAVDLEAFQAGVHRLGDHLASEVGAAVADPVAPARAGDLGRDHQVAARTAREPVAEILLGATLRRRVRRHRVHFRGVDEIDALLDRVVELLVGLRLGVLLAPGHRAEADLGDLQVGAGEGAVFHAVLALFTCGSAG